ncbi:prothymosin alpha isoform X3 [Camelus ferus]|uniref:Prothymosin alpha isoform X3 n=1 Tax=Camelus ferus TaxID=419612 RepID=A0A8B8T2L3_CAMFR|nr:prothymosin alpha isoform X1 [Camelus dromedarius]XP_032336379.1 prothymosin alpha isoform X3 [Camelus ferus]
MQRRTPAYLGLCAEAAGTSRGPERLASNSRALGGASTTCGLRVSRVRGAFGSHGPRAPRAQCVRRPARKARRAGVRACAPRPPRPHSSPGLRPPGGGSGRRRGPRWAGWGGLARQVPRLSDLPHPGLSTPVFVGGRVPRRMEKDLKEKKEVVEEAENGREAPANGNAVRKRMEMKMRRLRQLRANGQLKMMRMTMLTPRSRRLMRMTRQQKRKS